MSKKELPADLARLWRFSTGSRMGRPAELDVDQVVWAAVGLADQDGLAGVTLPKVAAVLGFTTMSLYRYVGSKDELWGLMADLVIGPQPAVTETEHWREGLRQWAIEFRKVCLRHPWLVRLPISEPPRGPNSMGWLDAGLAVMRYTTLGWDVKIGIITLLDGYVRNAVKLSGDLEAGRRSIGRDQAQVEREYGATMIDLVDPDRFPQAAQLFASGVFDAGPSNVESADSDFEFGLTVILDGIAATVQAELGPV